MHMRAQRHDHLIAYQERLRVHHIEESDGETVEAREREHRAADSDDRTRHNHTADDRLLMQ